jgi:hypothetical protein
LSKNIIGLNSFNLYEEPKYIEVLEKDFCYETIFSIDRSIRSVVQEKPRANWNDIAVGLKNNGFKIVDEAIDKVFWHARRWDEHLAAHSQSFFVTFPDTASPEIAGQVFFATNYPALFAIVSTENLPQNGLLLINSEHEVIYPDDLVWSDETCSEYIPIGPMVLIENQFANESEINQAKRDLLISGFDIFKQSFVIS